ncbi:two component system sensor kinase [Dyella sp. M7H15-1]|uniref:two component system sensor kinase n=1 Tax=Dyella sp. M7H15-1 TaxID=2501295 RepID=UPI00100511A3|nr:two component system sensor kinase [Dyella sp. M7H15-1]QAU24838.1 two component system sensor kinase [Dyella sp. M7H15-1]
MTPLPLRHSLSFRLSVVLSAATFLAWLATTIFTFCIVYRDTRDALVQRLQLQAQSLEGTQSHNLRKAAHDVNTLLRHWQASQQTPIKEGRHYLTSEFIPTPGAAPVAPEQLARAVAVAEAYGISGIGNIVNSFVLLNSGTALHHTLGNDKNLQFEVASIQQLNSIPSVNGLKWGRPRFSHNGQWQLTVGAVDSHTDATIGMTVALPSFVYPLGASQQAQLFWLDGHGQPLTPLSPLVSPDMLARIPDCITPFSERIGNVRFFCNVVNPIGWRLVEVYPAERITNQAQLMLKKRVPLALLAFVILVGLFYFVLRYSLGRTLKTFVRVIGPHQKLARLPEHRPDELGQIALAYNHLLDVVQAHYTELEAKVAERTIALDAAKRQAEQASSSKSEQITSISHEIRTPLNGLVGALVLLRKTPCDDNQSDLIDTAVKCSGHLLEIINNLLDFSRIESGQMVVSQNLFDPLDIIDQAMLTVQAPALNKHLQLTTLVTTEFPSMLHTDGLRLRQILINLLGNAVKFSPSGKVKLYAWSDDKHLYFDVTDTGPGVAPEDEHKVFAAFSQLDTYVPGSGLGLPIARSLAQLLGGDLRLLRSEIGAHFQLELPTGGATQPANQVPGTAIAAPLRLHNQLKAWGYVPYDGENATLASPELAYLPARLRMRLDPHQTAQSASSDTLPMSAWSLQVLIVDDIDTNRNIIGRMLQQQGHRTFEAVDGETALALGRTHIFDLVLMDIRMPGLSGSETTARWRSEDNGMLDPDCPIIALTANSQPAERERLMTEGFNEYLTKPVMPATLAQAIEYAADLQLMRGVELMPNTGAEQPMLGNDQALMTRVRALLLDYHTRIDIALMRGECETSLEWLHAFKGIAGQAGLDFLYETAAHCEQRLQAGDLSAREEWTSVRVLIKATALSSETTGIS